MVGITTPQKRCDTCKFQAKRHPRGEQFSRERMGCFGVIPNKVYEVPSVSGMPKVNYYKCPTNFASFYVRELVNQFDQFSRGVLPYSGGYDEQPAKFVEAMQIIENLIDYNREQTKKQMEKLNRGK